MGQKAHCVVLSTDQRVSGLIPESSSHHAEVTLAKALNPKLPKCIITVWALYESLCEWLNATWRVKLFEWPNTILKVQFIGHLLLTVYFLTSQLPYFVKWIGRAQTDRHTELILTAIVVVTPWQKLKPQWKGCEPLDLLREAHWSKRSVGGVAFPSLDGSPGLHTAFERCLTHQVEGQSLWLSWAHWLLVGEVRAINVQVVVQVHLDGQISWC